MAVTGQDFSASSGNDGMLFSQLPSNDLDAILMPCTTQFWVGLSISINVLQPVSSSKTECCEVRFERE